VSEITRRILLFLRSGFSSYVQLMRFPFCNLWTVIWAAVASRQIISIHWTQQITSRNFFIVPDAVSTASSLIFVRFWHKLDISPRYGGAGHSTACSLANCTASHPKKTPFLVVTTVRIVLPFIVLNYCSLICYYLLLILFVFVIHFIANILFFLLLGKFVHPWR
jgi:hypothetical protein